MDADNYTNADIVKQNATLGNKIEVPGADAENDTTGQWIGADAVVRKTYSIENTMEKKLRTPRGRIQIWTAKTRFLE